MATYHLPHFKALGVKDVGGGLIALDYDHTAKNRTVSVSDTIAVLKAPPENGFVEQDHILLSIHKHSSDTPGLAIPASKDRGYALDVSIIPDLPAILLSYMFTGLPEHLKLPKEDIHIILSTLSGACEAEQFYEGVVLPVFSLIGLTPDSYTLHRTTSDHSIVELAAGTLSPRANTSRPQTVVLLSGDGGIVDMINGILGVPRSAEYIKPTVGLLALGTGNALANSSGLNNDTTKGLSAFLRGSPHLVPAFRILFSPDAVFLTHEGQHTEVLPKDVNGHGFLNGVVVASWGLHSSLVADSDTIEYRKFGSDRFSMAANELLAPADGSESHKYRGKVTLFKLDESNERRSLQWESTEHMYLLATFVSNLEKTLTISPKSQPLDGKLRLVHFGALPSEDVTKIFGLAFDGGKHVDHKAVGYEEIEGMRVDFDEAESRWRRVCVDGKIVRVEEGGWIEVHKENQGAINLVVLR